MCRFSVTQAPPAQPAGLDALLEDDGFDWFEAIEELGEDALLEPGTAPAPLAPQYQGPSGRAEAGSPGDAESKPAASGAGSDSSSYDLVEMFKQQVEQADPAAAPAPRVSAGGQQQRFGASPFFSPAAAAAHQQQAAALAAAAAAGCDIKMSFPLPAAACLPPALWSPGAAAGAFLPAAAAGLGAPALLNNTMGVALPVAAPAPMAADADDAEDDEPSDHAEPAPAPALRKPRGQRTQAELDAAVERIKQKRRESAQRSRARKNEYMRQLELENQALKDEVARLQHVLATLQHSSFQQHHAAALMQLGAV